MCINPPVGRVTRSVAANSPKLAPPPLCSAQQKMSTPVRKMGTETLFYLICCLKFILIAFMFSIWPVFQVSMRRQRHSPDAGVCVRSLSYVCYPLFVVTLLRHKFGASFVKKSYVSPGHARVSNVKRQTLLKKVQQRGALLPRKVKVYGMLFFKEFTLKLKNL